MPRLCRESENRRGGRWRKQRTDELEYAQLLNDKRASRPNLQRTGRRNE